MKILTIKKHIFLINVFFLGAVFVYAQEPVAPTFQDSIVNAVIGDIAFQPKEEATVTVHEDSRIKKLLAIKSDMDRKGRLSDNYRIQLYYGNITEANTILSKAKEEFPNWEVEIIYETPNYKVWLGNYRNKLDVDRALKEVTLIFPEAFSFKPDK